MKDIYEGNENYEVYEEVDEIAVAFMALLMGDNISFEFCGEESDAEMRLFNVLSCNPVQVAVKRGEAEFSWRSERITDPALMDYYAEAIAYDCLDDTGMCRTFLVKDEDGCYVEAAHSLYSKESGEDFACTVAYNQFLFQVAVNGIVKEMKEMEAEE